MERRTKRAKPAFGKRMLVCILSLVMLLSVISPGLLAGAEETTSFLDSYVNAYDQQLQSGGEALSSLALSYIAKYDVLKEKVQALDPAAETYAADVQALNAEIAALDAAVASAGLTESEVAAVRAAAVGSVAESSAAAVSSDAALTNKTVTAYVDQKTFAVTGKLPEGVTLSVQKLDDAMAAFIRSDVLGLGALPAGYVGGAYDIKLMQNGTEIQPSEAVTLGVTADGITSKADVNVYHLPGTSADSVSAASGTSLHGLVGNKVENVNCYDAGYYAFYTNGFSVYYISTGNLYASVAEEEEETVELNDVAAGYVAQYAVLRARALELDPESETYEADFEALGAEAEVIDNAAVASYEAGEFDEAQWNVVSQASADFYAALFGEDGSLNDVSAADTLEADLTITQGQSGTYNGVSNARSITSTTISPETDGITLSVSNNRIVVAVADSVAAGTYTISGNYRNNNNNNRTYSFTVEVLADEITIADTIYVPVGSTSAYNIDIEESNVTLALNSAESNGITASVSGKVFTVTEVAVGAESATFVATGTAGTDTPVTVTLTVIPEVGTGTAASVTTIPGATVSTSITNAENLQITGEAAANGITASVDENGNLVAVVGADVAIGTTATFDIAYQINGSYYESTFTVNVNYTKGDNQVQIMGVSDTATAAMTGASNITLSPRSGVSDYVTAEVSGSNITFTTTDKAVAGESYVFDMTYTVNGTVYRATYTVRVQHYDGTDYEQHVNAGSTATTTISGATIVSVTPAFTETVDLTVAKGDSTGTITVTAGAELTTGSTYDYDLVYTLNGKTYQSTYTVLIGTDYAEITSLNALIYAEVGGNTASYHSNNGPDVNSISNVLGVYDANGYALTVTTSGSTKTAANLQITVSNNRVNVKALEGAVPGTYFIKVNTNSWIKVVVCSEVPGYVLDMYYYNTSTKIDYALATFNTAGTSATVLSNSGDNYRIKSVTLNSVAVNEHSSGTAISNYYGSLTSSSPTVSKTLIITPMPGYYVTRVIVACQDNPGNCQTFGNGDAFTKSFNVDPNGYVSFGLPSNSFGHSSSDDHYTILIEVAPLPSPLYVEYQYGDIYSKLDADGKETFDNADAWTDDVASNYYGSGSDKGVKTNDTQMKYSYADEDQTDVTKWNHTVNSVTNEAKLAAARAGYYFDGWLAYYYNECTESDTDNSFGYNYTYSFSGDYSSTATPYNEGDDLAMTTHVKLIAQWKPVKLTVTKTVVGLPSGTNAFAIDVLKDGSVYKTASLNVTGSSSDSITYDDPIVPATYSADETSAPATVTIGDVVYYLVSATASDDVTVTAANIASGAQKTVNLSVTNTYAEAAPKLKLVKKWLNHDGTELEDTSSILPASVTFNIMSGDEEIASSDVTYDATAGGWIATMDVPAGYTADQLTVTEDAISGFVQQGDVGVQNEYVESEKAYYTVYTITNKLSVSSATVSKTVTGNMADQAKEFSFTASVTGGTMNGITFTKSDGTIGTITTETYTFTLKHDQYIVFNGLVIGSELQVVEAESAYTVYVDNTLAADRTGKVTVLSDGTASLAFRNNHQVDVDTGVEMESFPFIMMLSSVIVMAAFFLIGKKRMMF